jgi:hypothetical protein
LNRIKVSKRLPTHIELSLVLDSVRSQTAEDADYISCTETDSELEEEDEEPVEDKTTVKQEGNGGLEVADVQKKAVNVSFYDGINAEESEAIQEKRKLVNRRR